MGFVYFSAKMNKNWYYKHTRVTMGIRSETVMWKSLKQKLYDFFFYEKIEMIEVFDEEKNDEKPVEIKDPTLETKVKYEYPTKKNFRFPIIPDYESNQVYVNDETLEIPAYKRQERTLNRSLNKSNNSQEQVEEQQPKREATFTKETVSGGSNRFIPTEVPSPIYGYQRREKERTLQNTPAYIRRNMRQEEHDVEQETAATVTDDVDEKTPEQEVHEDNQEANERKEEQIHTIEEVQDPPPIETMKRVTHESQESQGSTEPTEQKDSFQQPNRQHSANTRKKNPSDDIPVNVMMTRQDKERYERQLHKQKVEPSPSNSSIEYTIPMHLLNDPIKKDGTDREWLRKQRHLLEETFKHFNVDATIVNVTQGPSVTRFEVQPSLGVKVSKVRNLSDDIKLNLSAKDIRIEAPIPGKNTIGIEIPNLHAQTVGLYEILQGNEFMKSTSDLPIGLGVTIEGKPMITDVANMPHGLIAGATGSGKSVCINTILLSLLYRNHYDDVKLMLIDPKMVELTPYNGIPHLVSPVITDIKAANAALKWAVEEMESRYEKFVEEGVRDIHRFNSKVVNAGRTSEKMPSIVIVIDELADLMMIAPQDVEDSICRIAQKARACGMHLLIATQRPSVDVITGLIKANVPTRIAFSVSSQVDSRTIIDSSGAERLLGKGDMLFIENGKGKSIRLQGAFVSDEEIDRVVQMVKKTGPTEYLFEQEQLLEMSSEMDDDPLLEEVISFIMEQQSASTSMLQRQFRVGYNRAARLMETLEQRGVISGQNGSKPRDVLVHK